MTSTAHRNQHHLRIHNGYGSLIFVFFYSQTGACERDGARSSDTGESPLLPASDHEIRHVTARPFTSVDLTPRGRDVRWLHPSVQPHHALYRYPAFYSLRTISSEKKILSNCPSHALLISPLHCCCVIINKLLFASLIRLFFPAAVCTGVECSSV